MRETSADAGRRRANGLTPRSLFCYFSTLTHHSLEHPTMRGYSHLLALASVGIALGAMAADRLPGFNGDATGTAVTGLSSGAYMAVQYEVAYSASVKGAGVVAGGPYYCAAGLVFNAGICMGQIPGAPPVAAFMLGAARSFAALGKIDSLDHLKSHRVYVYSGTNDQIVKQQAVDAAVDFYRLAGVANNALLYVNTVPSGHAMITTDFGNECASNAAPSVNHCAVGGTGYDQAGAILQHIYGRLNPPARELGSKVVAFNQNEFAASAARMADEGYVYVPKSCASGASCRLLIAFHGCVQSASKVGDIFYAHAGFNRWADTNKLMVLYPQVNASLLNPQGCWDWFGYTGSDYATRTGPQLVAVKAMADRLLRGGI
jgi:poly(3-hydroxybutyrate) depolymerase